MSNYHPEIKIWKPGTSSVSPSTEQIEELLLVLMREHIGGNIVT